MAHSLLSSGRDGPGRWRKQSRQLIGALVVTHGQYFVARFKREANTAASLNHSNIVQVFDNNIMSMPYFEMELCDGSLAEVHKPVEVEEAAWILSLRFRK